MPLSYLKKCLLTADEDEAQVDSDGPRSFTSGTHSELRAKEI